MREVVQKLEEAKILSAKERDVALEVMRVRNSAVHLPAEPGREEAREVIAVAKQFQMRFDADI